MIEAANAEEEALAIAVALREAVDEPDKTAALVTPDRALARRVLAALGALERAGRRFRRRRAGRHAGRRVRAACRRGRAERPAAGDAAGAAQASAVPARCAAAVSTLGARDPARPAAASAAPPGSPTRCKTFRGELEKFHRRESSALHRSDPRTSHHRCRARCRDRSGRDAEDGAGAAGDCCRAGPQRRCSAIADAARRRRSRRARRHHRGTGQGASTKSPTARQPRRRAGRLSPSCSRPPSPTAWCGGPRADVRVRIYGPLEARLQSVDRLVLGGLVEGVWPPETRSDPWLSRPMRHELGLDLPERRIGLSAHDFAQALGAPEVILTRAAKLGGAPTVASRFVQRLAAVAGEARWDAALRARRALSRRWRASSTQPPRSSPPERGRRRGRRSPRGRRRLQRHRDRGLAARPLHDLRQACPEARAARRGRHAARRAPTAAP